MIPPKRFDISPPDWGMLRGLDAFIFFFKYCWNIFQCSLQLQYSMIVYLYFFPLFSSVYVMLFFGKGEKGTELDFPCYSLFFSRSHAESITVCSRYLMLATKR